MPDNREIASLVLLTAALAWILSQQKLRESTGGIVKALFRPLIVIPLLAMLSWIAFELWVGGRLSLWNATLIKGTILWALGSACILFFNCTRAASEPHFFWHTLIETVGLMVFMEFFMNLYVMSVPAEFVLQVVVIGLSLADRGAMADFQPATDGSTCR